MDCKIRQSNCGRCGMPIETRGELDLAQTWYCEDCFKAMRREARDAERSMEAYVFGMALTNGHSIGGVS